jgi:hypothetical protein
MNALTQVYQGKNEKWELIAFFDKLFFKKIVEKIENTIAFVRANTVEIL